MIELWNKIDLLDREQRRRLINIAERQPVENRPVLTSALTGEGLENLATVIETRLAHHHVTLQLRLAPADGEGLAWLHRNTDVLAKTVADDGSMTLIVRADKDKAERARHKFEEVDRSRLRGRKWA